MYYCCNWIRDKDDVAAFRCGDKSNQGIEVCNGCRKKSIKMSGEKCSSGSKSIFDCHCNDCHNHIIEYLGKKKGEVYFYNGQFSETYIQDKKVEIIRFSTDEDEKTSSCECFIKLHGGEGGQCEWIPRREIINNLIEVSK